jgi:hypothetical protein
MSELIVERCDPRTRAAQIKDLFARNGQPGFDAVFERAYRARAASGLWSWVGSVGGRAVMHISVTPQAFADGSRTLMGGLLGDLMVEEPHRDFWAPLRLLRTLVGDLKREGRLDFLLTTTTTLAESLFKAGGFKPFGRFRRFVFPLFGPYIRCTRFWSGARPATVTPTPLGDAAVARLLPSLRSADHWRARACPEFYATRIPREEYADGVWLRVSSQAEAGSPGWGLLSRHSRWSEVRLSDLYWGAGTASLEDIVLAAAQWSRANRVAKLATSTLDESGVSGQLKHAGFLARSYLSPVLLQQLGPTAPPPVTEWFVTAFVGTAW